MPIKHAALKQIRKDHRRHARNHAVQSELKTLTKNLVQLLNAQKLEEARTLLRAVVKTYDHAASKGILHRNTAARYKSRLTRRFNNIQPKTTSI